MQLHFYDAPPKIRSLIALRVTNPSVHMHMKQIDIQPPIFPPQRSHICCCADGGPRYFHITVFCLHYIASLPIVYVHLGRILLRCVIARGMWNTAHGLRHSTLLLHPNAVEFMNERRHPKHVRAYCAWRVICGWWSGTTLTAPQMSTNDQINNNNLYIQPIPNLTTLCTTPFFLFFFSDFVYSFSCRSSVLHSFVLFDIFELGA